MSRGTRRRVLLGQLGARGDCLYATAVARQIKSDLPDCELTWAVGTPARPIVEHSPHVDEIWEVPLTGHDDMAPVWRDFVAAARERQRRGEYDELHLTQIYPDNYANFDGTVRASIFRGYPRPITVPVDPVVRLSGEQISRVRRFADRHRLGDYAHRILFEFGAASGQSFVTPEIAHEVARRVLRDHPNACVVLSSGTPIETADPRLIDGGQLPFLENAELMRHCSLLVGCSSGISWLATSEWATKLPMVQLLRASTSVFASVVHDHEYFGLPTGHVLEMTDCSTERIASCIGTALREDFEAARRAFHQRIPVRFGFYANTLSWLVRRGEPAVALKSLRVTLRRYGPRPRLLWSALRVFSSKTAWRSWRRLRRSGSSDPNPRPGASAESVSGRDRPTEPAP